MNNNLSRFADSKVYFQCPICTKSMDIQGNSLICRHGHCFDISRYGYVNLLLKSSPKTNYSKRSFDNRHQILEYGMYDVVLEKIIQFISDTPSIRNILDVGCGEGFYARQIQQRTERNIFAFDLSRDVSRTPAASPWALPRRRNRSRYGKSAIREPRARAARLSGRSR